MATRRYIPRKRKSSPHRWTQEQLTVLYCSATFFRAADPARQKLNVADGCEDILGELFKRDFPRRNGKVMITRQACEAQFYQQRYKGSDLSKAFETSAAQDDSSQRFKSICDRMEKAIERLGLPLMRRGAVTEDLAGRAKVSALRPIEVGSSEQSEMRVLPSAGYQLVAQPDTAGTDPESLTTCSIPPVKRTLFPNSMPQARACAVETPRSRRTCVVSSKNVAKQRLAGRWSYARARDDRFDWDMGIYRPKGEERLAYRVWSDQNSGINTRDGFMSGAFTGTSTSHPRRISPEYRDAVHAHLKPDDDVPSPFISVWTTLMPALRAGLYDDEGNSNITIFDFSYLVAAQREGNPRLTPVRAIANRLPFRGFKRNRRHTTTTAGGDLVCTTDTAAIAQEIPVKGYWYGPSTEWLVYEVIEKQAVLTTFSITELKMFAADHPKVNAALSLDIIGACPTSCEAVTYLKGAVTPANEGTGEGVGMFFAFVGLQPRYVEKAAIAVQKAWEMSSTLEGCSNATYLRGVHDGYSLRNLLSPQADVIAFSSSRPTTPPGKAREVIAQQEVTFFSPNNGWCKDRSSQAAFPDGYENEDDIDYEIVEMLDETLQNTGDEDDCDDESDISYARPSSTPATAVSIDSSDETYLATSPFLKRGTETFWSVDPMGSSAGTRSSAMCEPFATRRENIQQRLRDST